VFFAVLMLMAVHLLLKLLTPPPLAKSAIGDILKKFASDINLSYQPVSASRQQPLFAILKKSEDPDNDEGENHYAFFDDDIKHLIKGGFRGQFIEGFVQTTCLDLGSGDDVKDYFVAEINIEKYWPNVKLFAFPAKQIRRFNKTGRPFSFLTLPIKHWIETANIARGEWQNFSKFLSESSEFNESYNVWFGQYAGYDPKTVYQILTPEFMQVLLEYPEGIYFEVIYDRLRIYHSLNNLSDTQDIEKIFKLLIHLKENITRHDFSSRL